MGRAFAGQGRYQAVLVPGVRPKHGTTMQAGPALARVSSGRAVLGPGLNKFFSFP